jgi:hypothetical protein
MRGNLGRARIERLWLVPIIFQEEIKFKVCICISFFASGRKDNVGRLDCVMSC